MTTTKMTASGASLREWVQEQTGCDPATEPDFRWSNTAACDGCGVHDSTAVLSMDGEAFERLCYHCAADDGALTPGPGPGTDRP